MTSPTLRDRRDDDLPTLWRWRHGEANPAWKDLDAPYFHEHDTMPAPTLDDFVTRERERPLGANRRVVEVDGALVGMVTRSEEAPSGGGWWELGIVLYDPASWSGGIGTRALTSWTDLTFAETNAHVLTLTTWSGNERMTRLAEKLGYQECARVREARNWQGQRFDSVRFDLLRSEWAARQVASRKR